MRIAKLGGLTGIPDPNLLLGDCDIVLGLVIVKVVRILPKLPDDWS